VRTGKRGRLAVALTGALIVPAFAAQGQKPAPAAADYVIGAEDLLEISVWDNTQISRTVPVRPDGKISLPLLNDVQAAGLTPMQMREVLNTLLTPFIPLVDVSVIVREVRSFKVTVLGEVRTPGRYDIRSRSTVLDLLASAGGLTEYAARNRIVVLRRDGAGRRQIPFPFDRIMQKPGAGVRPAAIDDEDTADVNFDVEPDDIILVP
jgi:polysaccharide export outer membrane protein